MTEDEELNDISKKIENPISLFTKSTESADSVISVNWCIKKEALEALEQEEIINPCLLLVVVKLGENLWLHKEVGRKLVPLGQLMEYIQFQGPGLHKIMAAIVWHDEEDIGKLKRYFLAEYSRNSFRNNVLSYERDTLQPFSDNININMAGKTSAIQIDVAEGFFAKEPPKWLKWWVNLWFTYEPADQCDFRRRCLITFPWKSILVLLWLAGKEIIGSLIILFLLLCGVKGIDFSPIRRPFFRYMNLIWRDVEGSIFINRKYPYIFPFTPIIPLALIIMVLTSAHLTGGEINIWEIIIFSITSIASISLGIALFQFFYMLMSLLNKAFDRIDIWLRKNMPARKPVRKKPVKEKPSKPTKQELKRLALKLQYKNLSSVVCCENRTPILSLKDLPQEKRTFHLWFLDLKAKVCKPFARY